MRKNRAFTEADLPALTKGGARARVQLGRPLKGLEPVELVRIGGTKEKTPKYRNRKADHGGMVFDSERERDRWLALSVLARAGKIRDLQRQVVFELAPSVDLGEKRRKPALRYKADFAYLDEAGNKVVEDAKGMVTPEYRIKKHLMMSVHGILVREV